LRFTLAAICSVYEAPSLAHDPFCSVHKPFRFARHVDNINKQSMLRINPIAIGESNPAQAEFDDTPPSFAAIIMP